MTTKIESNRNYRSTNSGMVVKALGGITENHFSGLVVLKGNSDYKVGSVLNNLTIAIFELLEEDIKEPKVVNEYKHPTLFQIVTKYQYLGFNLDFDVEPYGGGLNCHITHLPTRSKPLKINYNVGVSEEYLIGKLLNALSRITPEASRDLRSIDTGFGIRDIDREPVTWR